MMEQPDDECVIGGRSGPVWISPNDIECSRSPPVGADCYQSNTLRVQGHAVNVRGIAD